jgi:hypothetical membrane protein
VQTIQTILSAFDQRDLMRKSGAAGAGIIFAGSLIAALFYRGRLGEAYNPLNHFVSELGEVGISAAAWAFNGGLLIGGVMLVVFLVALGRRIGGWLGALFGAVGLACGVCGTAVGAVPMNDLLPHIFWARSFFNLGLGTMLFFSVIALLGRPGLPRRLASPARGQPGLRGLSGHPATHCLRRRRHPWRGHGDAQFSAPGHLGAGHPGMAGRSVRAWLGAVRCAVARSQD